MGDSPSCSRNIVIRHFSQLCWNPHSDEEHINYRKCRYQFLHQNPNAVGTAFNAYLKRALVDLENDYQTALQSVEEIKQTIRAKRTTEGGIEDRMKMYGKKVFKLIEQLVKAAQDKAVKNQHNGNGSKSSQRSHIACCGSKLATLIIRFRFI